jgi:predicted dehydrogenase
MAEKLRVLIVGLGNMGLSHARAYDRLASFEIAGVCTRRRRSEDELPAFLRGTAQYDHFGTALRDAAPDCVCICSWPDTHAEFALQALDQGAHVFIEKPLATSVAAAEEVVDAARSAQRKLVVGYILRHHPSWMKFVEIAQTLGKPLLMRMNLNQQSSGATWETHKRLMDTVSPIVDCGVHYVDVMCQMTNAEPVSVHAIGLRLSDELDPAMYNYGHLQVTFDDGSVGWYEAGWGPMMSETAFFVKDVVGPTGAVSIVGDGGDESATSDIVDAHTKTSRLRVHHGALNQKGEFSEPDTLLDMRDEPDHDALCEREQQYFLRSISEGLDLEAHQRDAINSLRIVLAADQSIRERRRIELL